MAASSSSSSAAEAIPIANGPHSHETEVLEFTYDGDCEQVYTDFVENFWVHGGGLGGAKPKLVERGDAKSYAHSLRLAGPIKEYIFHAEHGKLLEYTILAYMPVSTYRATITFAPAAANKTKVTWKADFSPLVPLTGPVLRYLLTNHVYRTVLENFAQKQQKQKAARL